VRGVSWIELTDCCPITGFGIQVLIFLVSWSGVRLSLLGTAATICPIIPAPDDR
jgi:hypothetical protein